MRVNDALVIVAQGLKIEVGDGATDQEEDDGTR
jgi:hypothetical protein